MSSSVKIFKRLKKTISGQRTREKKKGGGRGDPSVNPSVLDYSTVKELKDALLGKNRKRKKKKKASTSGKESPTTTSTTEEACDEDEDEEEDYTFTHSTALQQEEDDNGVPGVWKLSNLDVATSEPQTMAQEVERLTALQSYFILDASTSAEFDQITDMAAKVFDVPVACITMIDLGRLWFLTAAGIPNANGIEAPRKVAICAHVIKTKLNCLVVPDASVDERFKDSPLVSDPNGPSIRFYAGCPLIVPAGNHGAGAKLGTFCIIDQKPRQQEFTVKDQQILQDMAALAVNALVARRNRLLKQEQDSKMLELAESYAEMHSCLCKATSCVAGAVKAAASVAQSRSRRRSGGGGASTIASTKKSQRRGSSASGGSLADVSETKMMDGSSEVSGDDSYDDGDGDYFGDGSIASYEELAEELKLHTDLSAANARTIVLDSQETEFQFDNMEAVMENELESFVDPKEQEELEKAKKKMMVPPAYVRLLQATNSTMDNSDNYSVASRSLRGASGGGRGQRNSGSSFNYKMMPQKTISNSSTTTITSAGAGGSGGAVNVLDMYQNLNDICSRFVDRPVPIHVELLGNVPPTLVCRGTDLLVFQATMSLLANANARVHRTAGSNDGNLGGMIHICISTIHDGSTLLVECQDTGCFAAEWEGSMEFHNPQSLLYPVRKISRSLGGDCGMRLGCFEEERGNIDEKTIGIRASAQAAGIDHLLLDDVEHEQQYCIFWWSMPLILNLSTSTTTMTKSTNGDDAKLDDSSLKHNNDDDDTYDGDKEKEEEEDRETLLKTHEATINGHH